MPSLEENLLTQRHYIWSQEARDSRLPYGKNPESLSHLGLVWYRDVPPGRTDEQIDGRTDRQPHENLEITTRNLRRII